MNSKSHVILFFTPRNINRRISCYKEKQKPFFKKAGRKKHGGKYDTCVYREGSILDGSAISVGIFDSNYSSWSLPLFHLMLKWLIMAN